MTAICHNQLGCFFKNRRLPSTPGGATTVKDQDIVDGPSKRARGIVRPRQVVRSIVRPRRIADGNEASRANARRVDVLNSASAVASPKPTLRTRSNREVPRERCDPTDAKLKHRAILLAFGSIHLIPLNTVGSIHPRFLLFPCTLAHARRTLSPLLMSGESG